MNLTYCKYYYYETERQKTENTKYFQIILNFGRKKQ